MYKNDKHQVIISEDDMLDLIYQGKDVQQVVVNDRSWVDKFNNVSKLFDIQTTLSADMESKLNPKEYVTDCVSVHNWNLPDRYVNMDMYSYLINKCRTDQQRDRVEMEYDEYERRNMIPVLKFLMYFIDTMRKENLVWGVGRGSSVASYILYLMDVHKIDSLKYDIPINEFLK